MSTQDRRITRLFVDAELGGERARLTERETNYLGSVLRLRRGHAVLAFNGRGQERFATISSLSRQQGELTLQGHVEPLPESPLRLTLVQALPKTDAMDFVVQKVTELGVRALWPIMTDYSVVKLDAERAERRALHWLRVARSACEQSGRHCPPEISPVASLAAALDSLPPDSLRLVLDPRSGIALDTGAQPADEVFLLVGPEGGFSEADLELIEMHDFARVRLGPRTLRAETAAVVAAGLLQSMWGDLRQEPAP